MLLARYSFDQTKHMAVQRMEAAACLAIAMLASEMRRAQGTDDRAIAHVEMALQKAVRRQSQLVRNLT